VHKKDLKRLTMRYSYGKLDSHSKPKRLKAHCFDFTAVNDRLFNTDVVIFRWIMTGKIGTKIVVARCVC